MQSHDREIADELMHSMESAGVNFKLGNQLEELHFEGPKVKVKLTEGSPSHRPIFSLPLDVNPLASI